MKKSLFFSAVALCALTIIGCNKEVDSPEAAPEGREIHFTINTGSPETKTFIEYDDVNHKYVPKWQNTDKLGVIFNAFGEGKKAVDAEFTNTLASGSTASFSGTGTVSGEEQTLYAFYPASAFAKAYSNSVIGLTIPEIQKPTATSFDPAADVLVNDPYALTIDDADVVISDMQFRRVGSVLRLTITDGTSTGKISSDKIKTVTVSSNMANAAFAGRYRYDFIGKKAYYNNGAVNEHMATKVANITADLTDNLLSVGDPIFLIVNPQDLAAESKLTVEIATDKHNITKEITLSQVLPFRGGTMTSISVGIKDEDSVTDALVSKTYVLVKDAAELTAGSEVIIADFGDENAVMSTNQATNNRTAVTVEKSTDKQSITTDNVNVQVFTVAEGNKANTIAFFDGEGYLYACSSSSNYLRTQEDLSDNSSWDVTIDSGTGEATVVAQGSYTRNTMRLNPNNGNPIFSCYASSSTTGTSVSIYKLEDDRTPAGLAWDDADGLGDIKSMETALPNLVNPNGLAPITYSSSDPTVATVLENEHTVTLLKAGTTQIHAKFAGNATYRAADVYYTLTVEDSRPAVTLAFATPSYALVVGSDDYNAFAGQTVTATPSVSGITYAISGDAIGTVDENTGVVTLDGATLGTATVTASFEGNASYKASEPVSYTISVSDGQSHDYELVTNIINVTEGEYIIVNDGYYLPNEAATSAGPAKVAVSISDNKVQNVTDAMTWTFSGTASGMTIQSTADPDNYLYVAGTSNNNQVRVNTTSDHTWTIAAYEGVSGAFTLQDNKNSRFCATYSGGSDWRSYNSFNANNYGDGGRVYLYKLSDNRQDPGMEWSAANATATYNTGNSLSFTAPTLDEGNATGITYESSDETIATIDNSGVVTITALTENNVKEGSTTISAVFTGDQNYKAKAVSYTLTVVDGRTAVATPGFDPAAGEVAENTVVSFTCADGGVIYHYTVNGSNPTIESPTGVSVTIDAAKTVKVIAVKDGYKPSAVAEAAYTVAGQQANDGSLEHPYTVAEALAIIAGYSNKEKSAAEVYVSGIIANVGNYNGTYHSVTYDISDDGQNANTLNIYSGHFVADTNFSSNEQISVGDEVVVYGFLYLYGTTKEMYQNNYIYSLNGKTKALTAGSLTATPDNANKQITVEWGAATGSSETISYTVTCGGQNYAANAAGSHVFTMADYGTYDVTVVASASDALPATASTTATLTDPNASTTSVVDVLTQSWTGVTGTSYTAWSGKTLTSDAVYAGNTAGSNSSIQLRSNNNNSGVITTTSGGKVRKIVVTWNASTQNGRTLNVYGKNTAYSAVTDLYNGSNQGTLLGTIVCGTSTELTIAGDYEFVGFRSNSGAMYLTSVEITWE